MLSQIGRNRALSSSVAVLEATAVNGATRQPQGYVFIPW